MKRLLTYFGLEQKRGIRLISYSLDTIIITLCILCICAFSLTKFMQKTQIFEKVKVGIVMPEDEQETLLLFNLISGLASTRSICDFNYINSDEYEYELLNGELQAVVIIPENFYHDVTTGINTPAKIIITSSSIFNTKVFKELALSGESILRTSEAALYSISDASKDYELSMSESEMEYYMSMLYLNTALDRNSIFDKITLSSTNGFTLEQYYFSSFFILFLILCSLSYIAIYNKQDILIGEKLKVLGIRNYQISLTKTLVVFCGLILFYILIYTIGCFICNILEINLLMWNISEILYSIPVVLSISAFCNCIFTIAPTQSQGCLGLIIITTIMAICTGGLLPAAYLPEICQKLTLISPFHYWKYYITNMLWGKIDLLQLIIIIAIFLFFQIINIMAFSLKLHELEVK